jgi:signal transduction histidine kinase
MNYFTLSAFLTIVFSTSLSFLLFWKSEKRKVTMLLGFFCLCVAVWGLGAFNISVTNSKNIAFFWWKIAYIGVIFTPIIYAHFVFAFLNLHKKRFLIFGYALALIWLAINFFPEKLHLWDLRLVFNQFYWIDWIAYKNPIFLFFYVVFYWGILFYPFFLLLRSYKIAKDYQRQQLKYFILGSIIGWFAPHAEFLLIFKIDIYPYSNFLLAFYPAIWTYAILRHKLLDIEVIIKKTLVFAGLLASVFAILVLPTLLIQEYIFRSASAGGKLLGLALSGTVIILLLRRIETSLVNVTDKYLFQKKYDYRELLRTVTSEVLTVVNLDKLVNLTVDKLTNIVKIDSCAVLLFDDEKQQFNVMASRNIKDAQVTLIRPDGIVTFLDQTQGYLLRKELAEKRIYIPPTIQGIIDKLNAELIIPMALHNDVMGVLSLGKKKSDEDYTQDDLDILLPLSRTLAIAISNAKLFDELGKTQAEAAQKEKMAVIGTLSAGINHEICNPLGIARGQCEAFLLNVKDGLYNDKSPEELLNKAKDIMAKVMKETDRATAITKKLSSFAKPAKGEAELVDIDKEVDNVLGLVGYELKMEKIEIEKQFDKDLPNILVDRKQLQEILFNLIRNAGQAIGEKGKIMVIARQEKGRIFIDIKDTGSGIPEDKLRELFNPFFTTKEPGKGTGLGLFIVRQVVEKNGGRIYLKETKVGEGTTFTVEFPAAMAHQESRA